MNRSVCTHGKGVAVETEHHMPAGNRQTGIGLCVDIEGRKCSEDAGVEADHRSERIKLQISARISLAQQNSNCAGAGTQTTGVIGGVPT